MKKEVILGVFFAFIFLSVFSVPLVVAQENGTIQDNSSDDDAVDLAYQCLKDQIDSKGTVSLSEAIYSSLALGNYDDLADTIDEEKSNSQDCWPGNSCNIEYTAKVLLSYEGMNKNTDDIVEWLRGKNDSVNGLNWYLEIDIQNQLASECTITYDGLERSIAIGEDQRISGNIGRCLDVEPNGYWLEIRESCIDHEYEISCDQDFVSTLLYEKDNGDTIFVSSETHSASALGSTNEQITARCFQTGSNCDYEGSLWAALALDVAGEDVSDFIPYLVAMAEDNKRYFPDSFLYILRGGEESYQGIIESQKQGKFWEVVGTLEDRYYDTSLALLALGNEGTQAGEDAKAYLLDIQTEEGCWDNNDIKSTGIVLYSVWPRSRAVDSGGGGGTSGDIASCESSGNYCVPRFACEEKGGLRANQYECSTLGTTCCTVDVEKVTCSERNGQICAPTEECSGNSLDSSDSNCCDSACIPREERENVCADNGGTCYSSCTDGEQETGDACPISTDVCCIVSSGSEESGSLLWLWIVLLVILIILVILGIVYRNKLRLWWHTFRNKNKGGRPGPGGPPARGPPRGFPPRGPGPRPIPVNRGLAPQPSGPPRRGIPGANKDYEETMKKLKEIGKG